MLQNYLIDANIFLDVILPNRKGKEESKKCLRSFEDDPNIVPWIAPHTLSVIYYLGRKELGKEVITSRIKSLLGVFGMAPLTSDASLKAFEYGMSDFEDAMQAASAEAIQAEKIVSWNTKDFKKSPVPCLTPTEFLAR